MENPWCIQRLEQSYQDFIPFERGIGIGGSSESRALIKNFVKHDYMGSAEFEFGSLPKAYEALGKSVLNYVKFKIEINKRKLFGFCLKSDVKDVVAFIKKDAQEGLSLKESTYLKHILNPQSEFSSLGKNTKGWFDIDNLFMYFLDQEMFNRFTKFYGIDSWDENHK